jgi:hypothetical protein
MKGGTKMRFELVRPDTYRAHLRDGVYIWVVCEGPHHWWWHLGSYEARHGEVWGTDNNGPFPSQWEAVADAIAAFPEGEEFVWYVWRPTCMDMLEPPYLWRLKAVIAGSERDRMLASKRTTTDAGEVVEIPGDWRRFESRAEAVAWLSAEAERWEKWHSFWIA